MPPPAAEASRPPTRRNGRLLAVLALAAMASRPGAAQTGTSTAEPSTSPAFSEEVSVAWILVPVIVKGEAGYLNRLERRDFSLKVDGHEVKFPDFEPRGAAPWSLVFLQDLSGSMGIGGRLEASRQALYYFLDASKPGDEFSLATFAMDSTVVDVPFTEEILTVQESIALWEPYGKTALHDAVALLPQISGDSRNVKRAAILITDGVDNASAISAEQARDIVRHAELPVYVFGMQSGDPYAASSASDDTYRYADVLNLLAHMTGGRYFSIDGPEDLKEACADVAEDLRYQYVLGFETAAAGTPAYRRIAVSVKSRKAKQVLFRKGYQGLAPAPPTKAAAK